ncbi:MAG: helix-turn-helix domain-containing protein [Elusimicrobia bacterium]|nr:helix-turn-helix domain-containing protein [Elusimicrobiota bacterium]
MTNKTPLEDVGALLKQERLRKGLSLEMVQKQTRIPRKFLDALEQNRTSEFPAVVYLQGFLRSYCELLGLDFDSLWSKWMSVLSTPANPEPQEAKHSAQQCLPKTGARPLGLQDLADSMERTQKKEQDSGESGLESRRIPLIGLSLILVAILSYWLTTLRAPKSSQGIAGANPFDFSSPLREVSLRLTMGKAAWIRLKIDGRISFEGWIPAGVTRDWRIKESAFLRTTTPEALNFVLNDKPLLLAGLSKDSSGDFILYSH